MLNNKIIIGIIGEQRIYSDKKLVVFNDSVLDIIIKYDCLPLGILPTNIDVEKKMSSYDIKKLHTMLDMCNGVILQGGLYIYEYQMEAVKYIKEKNIPVLGICLGMQIMALSNNGIKKRFKDEFHRSKKEYVHKVDVVKESRLYYIIGKESIMVNSSHICYIKEPGDYFVSSQYENIIESIELKDKLFHIGVQWHPEKLIDTDINMKKIVDAFFDACKKQDRNVVI